MNLSTYFSVFLAAAALACAAAAAPVAAPAAVPASAPPPASAAADTSPDARIAAYRSRLGRSRPVIAVIGENGGTELTDFMIPYGVLARSDTADLYAVATRDGTMTMRPALNIVPHATIAQFDARFPDGADYVIVPAVVRSNDPLLVEWIAAQSAKGGTIVSICDGALVVANSGLMKGRRATAHWATEQLRTERYPDTQWVRNVRYVVDGTIVSSAGISAALPVSLALVEAIAGSERAAALADELGVPDWSTRHDSDAFRPQFGVNLRAYAATFYTNGWLHPMDAVGVPVAAGIDEIALALTADAYSRTGRSQAYALSGATSPVPTRHGLAVLPDRVAGTAASPELDVVLPASGLAPAARALDRVLAGIAERYGRTTAFGVALAFEYPDFRD